MSYILHITILFEIYLIVAISMNVILGYLGLLSLAHSAYFAIGAYVYALTATVLGWGFVPAAAAATLSGLILSLPLSVASWRFRGDFFVLVSLAFQVMTFSVLKNWHDTRAPLGSWTNMTNGDFGIIGIGRPEILGYSFATPLSICLLYLAFVLVVLLISHVLLHSPWGRLLRALRDDELAAKGLGKNIRLLKVQAIGLSCAMAGFAGALFAGYNAFVNPELANLNQATLFLAMVVVGGLGGNLAGPVIGALVLVLLPEALRMIDLPHTLAAQIRLGIYGVLLILLMRFRPQGIAGKFRLE